MNLSVVAVTILGTFCRPAVRPPLAYNPAVVFTLNQDSARVHPRSTPRRVGEAQARPVGLQGAMETEALVGVPCYTRRDLG